MSVEVLSPECLLVASASVRRSGGNTAAVGGEADIQGHRSPTRMSPKATFGASFIAGPWNTIRARIAFPDIMQDEGGSAFLASVFRKAMGRRFHDRGSNPHAQRRDDRAFERHPDGSAVWAPRQPLLAG